MRIGLTLSLEVVRSEVRSGIPSFVISLFALTVACLLLLIARCQLFLNQHDDLSPSFVLFHKLVCCHDLIESESPSDLNFQSSRSNLV